MSDFEKPSAFKKSRFGSFYSVKTTYLQIFRAFLKSMIQNWKFFTCQILNWKNTTRQTLNFKKIQCVRFWVKSCTTFHILNQQFKQNSDFDLNILQRVRFWVYFLFAVCQVFMPSSKQGRFQYCFNVCCGFNY